MAEVESLRDMKIRWSAVLPEIAAHGTAITIYFLVVGVVPSMLALLLGLAQIAVWVVTGAPHPWGLHCLRFYLMPVPTWLTATSLIGLRFFIISTVLAVVRRWIRFSFWTPVILSFPVAFTLIRKLHGGGLFWSLLASAGFCVYWVAFWRHAAIMACPKRQLIKRSAVVLLGVLILMSSILITSFWKAKRLVDADLAKRGQTTRCIRASFVLNFEFEEMLDMIQPCWVFRYDGLARIYVSIPEYQVFQSGWALNPVPLFGVLP